MEGRHGFHEVEAVFGEGVAFVGVLDDAGVAEFGDAGVEDAGGHVVAGFPEFSGGEGFVP